MSKLDHAGIMKILDNYEDNKSIYLVMDLMGADLRNLTNTFDQPFEEKFARKLFADLVSAVCHCHQNNIIHCDLKLENILIDVDNRLEHHIVLKLTDFGIS